MEVCNSGMLNLINFYENKLGRQLNEEEVDFLQWLYNRYSEEKQAGLTTSFLIQESK